MTGGPSLEIERVFLLERLPALPGHAVAVRIEQGYLTGGSKEEEGRIRRLVEPDGSERYVRTVKRGMGLVREEHEHAISQAEFEALWPATAGRRIRKTRHRVAAGPVTWEVDEFHGIDVVLAEVELPTADVPVELPGWLAPAVVREVTDEPEYRNYALAVRAGLR